MRAAQLRVLGGAMARVDPDATAFAHRDRKIMVNVASFYEGDDGQGRDARPGCIDLTGALQQRDGAYVNFLADEGPERGPRRVSGPHLGPARGDQAALRPGQPVPPQPERAARRRRAVSERPLAARLLVKAGDAVWVSDAGPGAAARARCPTAPGS